MCVYLGIPETFYGTDNPKYDNNEIIDLIYLLQQLHKEKEVKLKNYIGSAAHYIYLGNISTKLDSKSAEYYTVSSNIKNAMSAIFSVLVKDEQPKEENMIILGDRI